MNPNTKRVITEAAEAVLVTAAAIALFVLYLAATPDQLSGEADLHEAALEAAGEEVR